MMKSGKEKNDHEERIVQRADFQGHLLELVIQQCSWSKVVAAQHLAYITLVKEFFANFNKDIDTLESSHRHQTWELATSVDSNSRCSIMFQCLISGFCLEVGVPLLPFEEVDTPEDPLTHKTTDNSKDKMRARKIRAQCAPVVQPDDAAPEPTPSVP
ncbi:hypothetical protein Adt_21836 [Abeliophyllum distichum]|uniref:Uncharacterized protein n=1 Tax=Abeliophyllum distichum TaxID=126358 RepID=A0ABD1T0G8_9LAMI